MKMIITVHLNVISKKLTIWFEDGSFEIFLMNSEKGRAVINEFFK